MSKKLRDNFDVRIKAPIDKRFQCNNLSDIDVPYEGLKTYQLSDNKFYKFVNGAFIEDNNDINNSISQINTKLSNNRIFNVLDFGAKGDGTTDDTNAFNAALLEAKQVLGSVFVPPSINGYLISGSGIVISMGVTLYGVSGKSNGQWAESKGSTLLITGTGTTPTFIMKDGSQFKNLNIEYPDQVTTSPPIAYPFLIQLYSAVGNDVTIRDVFLKNCYQFLDASTGHLRLNVFNIYGDIFKTGIVIGNNYDVDRIENIHFCPYDDINVNTALASYRCKNAKGIVIQKADGIQMSNIFAYGLQIGIVIGTTTTESWGQISNVLFDTCETGIYVINVPIDSSFEIVNYEYTMNILYKNNWGLGTTSGIVLDNPKGHILVNGYVFGYGDSCIYSSNNFSNSLVKIKELTVMGTLTPNIIGTSLITHNGTGSIKISNMESTLSKTLVTYGSGSSKILFENANVSRDSISTYKDYYNPPSNTTIASADTLNIPSNTKVITVTGSTAINWITGIQPVGTEIILIFSGSLTIPNSTSTGYRLNGALSATKNTVLTLISDGTNWLEKSRSINNIA
jgi:hypothetical protein